MTIKAIPTTYKGIKFRSTLEADWAYNLDLLGIVWQYEPEAFQLPSGTQYRPDFYLPEIATWLEVKGSHDERIDKVREFALAVTCPPDAEHADNMTACGDACHEYQKVIIGRPAHGGQMAWEGITDRFTLVGCMSCRKLWWVGTGAYGCRAHRRYQYGDGDLDMPFYDSPVQEGCWGPTDVLRFRQLDRRGRAA